MESLSLGKAPLQLTDLWAVALRGRKVELSPSARKRIQVSRKFLESEVASGKTLYGVNTGFGLLSNVRIPDHDLESLQYNLLRSHAVGTGAPLSEPLVRAMLLLRASTLAHGHSGVTLGLVEALLALLNKGVHPYIPEQGSVGASGDLAPLSHLALVLIGEGKAYYKGALLPGAKALAAAGLKPIRLHAKEGLALINGTQFMAALGSLALFEAEQLVEHADWIGALSCEAVRGTTAAFEPEIHRVRPHPGQIQSARNILSILKPEGKLSGIAKSHKDCGKVQDPYSFRCMPQVHGASRDLLAYVRGVVEREINSVTDNPLVFPEEKKILSGGNFHGQAMALAMDALAMATAEIANISEERLAKLVNPALSDLPAFLTPAGGLNSGFMIVQVSAAAIVSENKTLCHPASVDSIPTSADKEDHVSMGAWAARKALMVTRNSRRVLAMELLGAAQGIDLLRPLKTSVPLERLHQKVRKYSAPMMTDRSLHEDIETVEQLILQGSLIS
jgi:histidine ammonia-lyase